MCAERASGEQTGLGAGVAPPFYVGKISFCSYLWQQAATVMKLIRIRERGSSNGSVWLAAV